jgi:hypothetical protein
LYAPDAVEFVEVLVVLVVMKARKCGCVVKKVTSAEPIF